MPANQVLDCIAARRSHRQYSHHALTPDEVQALVLAALQSPSANNRQPWHFSVVQDGRLLDRIHEAAKTVAVQKENHSPRFDDGAFQVFYHAPCVIFISAQDTPFSLIDCGIAAQNVVLAAQSLGLGSVILGLPREAFQGEERAALEKALQFPDGYHFAVAVAVGHPADDKPAHDLHPEKVSYIINA